MHHKIASALLCGQCGSGDNVSFLIDSSCQFICKECMLKRQWCNAPDSCKDDFIVSSILAAKDYGSLLFCDETLSRAVKNLSDSIRPLFPLLVDLIKKFHIESELFLEVGCGAGGVSLKAAAASPVIAIDSNPECVKICREAARGSLHLKYWHEYPSYFNEKIETEAVDEDFFLCGVFSAPPIPVRSRHSYTSLCSNVIDVVTKPYLLLDELMRVTSTHGTIIIANPALWQQSCLNSPPNKENIQRYMKRSGWMLNEVHDSYFVTRPSISSRGIFLSEVTVWKIT